MPCSQRPEYPEMGRTTTVRWNEPRRAPCPSREPRELTEVECLPEAS